MITTVAATSAARASARFERVTRQTVALPIVAAAYWATSLLPIGARRGADVALSLACGFTLAMAVVLVAPRLNISRARQFTVWFALIFLNLAAVAVEGTLFAPALSPPSLLGANLIRLAIGSAVIAGAVALIFGTRARAEARGIGGWWWRVIAVAGLYLVLYLVLGGLNYSLVTHPYYESHAGSLTVPSLPTILLYQPVRGLLIAVSVLPLIAALRARTLVLAVTVGTLLFIAGGLVPLLPQSSLPLYLRVASLWEIFDQNFFTGVAAAYLFGRRPWRSR